MFLVYTSDLTLQDGCWAVSEALICPFGSCAFVDGEQLSHRGLSLLAWDLMTEHYHGTAESLVVSWAFVLHLSNKTNGSLITVDVRLVVKIYILCR